MENQTQIKPLKVLHFVHWSRSGITCLVKYIAEFAYNQDSFLMLLNGDKDFESYYSCIKNKVQLEADKNIVGALLLAIRHYNIFRPDVVHAHSLTPLLIAVCLFRKSKIIFHVHSYYDYFSKNTLKNLLKRTALRTALKIRNIKILAVSKEVESLVKINYQENVTFVPNGVSDIGAQRKLFSEEALQWRFYNVSRLHTVKNLDYAILLIKHLKGKGFNVSLDFYGDGDQKKHLQDLIDRNDLSDNVSLKGFITNPETISHQYDFYLSTALIEGIGLSMLNALRAKTPVIMTPKGELANTLTDNISAIFIDFNLESSAEKISFFLQQSVDDLDKIQLEGRRIFDNNFSLKHFLNALNNAYNDVIL